MRLRDENKRRTIIQTAIRLFSEQPFHKVRLDDVAAAAGVGKGTVYIYFKNKEELYYSLVYDGFADMVGRVKHELNGSKMKASARIETIVKGLVDFAMRHPTLFEVMRVAGIPDASTQWDGKRQEFSAMIEDSIRRGITDGEFNDPFPQYTAVYMMAMVRAVMLYSPRNVDAIALASHVSSVVLGGISKIDR